MIICKNLDISKPIRTTNEWFDLCPPAKGKTHWKSGRSAKETARHWLNGVPAEFEKLVRPLGVKIDIISPEYITNFDSYDNGRNHDLLILDQGNEIVIGVESKVDEPFSKPLSTQISEAIKEVNKNPRSNQLRRIEELRKAIFGGENKDQLELKYQLIFGLASVLSEARIQKYSKAIFVVQTFLSDEMDSEEHRTNQRDLDKFLSYISKGKNKIIHNGDLLGPFRVAGNSFIPNDVDLYIGKVDIRI
jgi:hypothetical protein